jgi:hypothetical protein
MKDREVIAVIVAAAVVADAEMEEEDKIIFP